MKKIITLVGFIILLLPLGIINVLASSAYFSVSSNSTSYVGSTIYSSISVYNASSYNAVSIKVSFSNLSYVNVSVSGGWTTVSGPSVSGNSVSFSGALLGNAATGTKSVLNLSLRGNNIGTGSISATGTIALADGSGTQVAPSGGYSSIKVVAVPPAPIPAPSAVTVTSTTHPDQTKWYKTHDVSLSWNKASDVTDFSYILDQTPSTVPTDTSLGAGTTKSYTGIINGTSYFHIKAKNGTGWGTVSNFNINIDDTSPDPFTITKDEKNQTIFFATNDTFSGIDHYTINIDGKDLGSVNTNYKLPSTYSKIIVTAFDKAGNSTQSILNVNTVTPSSNLNTQTPSPKPAQVANSTVYLLLLIPVGMFLFYTGSITYLYYKNVKAKKIKK